MAASAEPASPDPGAMLMLGAARVLRLQVEQLGSLAVPLTIRQLRILQRVTDGYTSVSDLSRLAHRSLPTTSESVDGLIKRGLLTRAGSAADRRAVVLDITPRGGAALDAAVRCIAELGAAIVGDLPAAEREAAGELGRRMYETAGRILWGDDA